MNTEKNKIDFNDLIAEMSQINKHEDENAETNINVLNNRGWYYEMKKQALSKTETEKLRDLKDFLYERVKWQKLSFVMKFLFFVIYTVGALVIYKEFNLFSNINSEDFHALGVVSGFLATWLHSFLYRKYKIFRNIIFNKGKLKKLMQNLNFNEKNIYIANYVIANLEIENENLRKKAITFILNRFTNKRIKVTEITNIIKELDEEYVICMSFEEMRELIREDKVLQLKNLN